jgi:hypothetical protein
MTFLEASQHPAKSGGKRAAVQTLREVWMHMANAVASGLRWLQHRFSPRARKGFLVIGLLFVAGVVVAQSPDDVPPLLPALPEIPPTLWEQHGLLIVVLGVLALALVGAAIWWLLQPKPSVPVPIEIQTRRELDALRQRTEDGRTLSEISRCLRRYFAVAFKLPPGELTTTEFCRLVAANEKVGGELATAVSEFLRGMDEKKFSPASSIGQNDAANRAIELFECGEKRRAELRPVAPPK